jgi:hypothetical protein
MADVLFTDLPVLPSLAGDEVVPVDKPNGDGTYTTSRTTTGAIAATAVSPSGVTPGTYGDAANVPQITVNADGFVTDAQNVPITAGSGTVTSVSVATANGLAGTVANPTSTPALTLSTTVTGVIKGDGTSFSAATAGVDFSAGTSTLATGILKSSTSSGTLSIAVAADFPTLNQNTTGSAAKWTTARNLAGNSVDGSASVPFANKFIAQGTADSGLTNAQFMGALATGIVKNTTTSGVQSIAVAGTDYQAPITLTTTGTSGAATLVGNVLNVPVYAAPTGTVTTVSVVSANGLAGTVANPSTTPAITLSTSVTGILQGNGTAISAASTTGSGNVVLATSPTLGTPNLGTPSAINLSNATGFPIVPTSSTLPVGWSGVMYNNSGVTVLNNATVAGTSLEIYVDNGAAQIGTWLNITGASVANGIAGLFVRTA